VDCPMIACRASTLRHSANMELLQAGVDPSMISLWPGHECSQSPKAYLHAHIALEEAAFARVQPFTAGKSQRFRPNDQLRTFLNAS